MELSVRAGDRTVPRVRALIAVAIVAWVLPDSAIASRLVYDVRFTNDPIGSVPATSAGPYPRFEPSPHALSPTLPQVVASAGALVDRPLVYEGVGYSGSYLSLDLEDYYYQEGWPVPDFDCIFAGGSNQECTEFSRHARRFDISLDLIVFDGSSPGNDKYFTVLLDTPTVMRLDFQMDGTVSLFDGNSGNTHDLGTFELGELLHVGFDVDLEHDLLSITFDDDLRHFGDVGSSIALLNFRLAMGTDAVGTVAVDNLRVLAIPEPGTAALMGLGLAVLGLRRARRLG